MKRITTVEAALILDKSPQFVRVAMQRGVLPIGIVTKMSSVYCYYISPKMLEEFTGLDVKEELRKIRGDEEDESISQEKE